MNPELTQTIELPENYSFRPTELADAEAVATLLDIVAQHNGISTKNDVELQRSSWQEPKFDLASSSRVVLDENDQIIANGTIWDNGDLPVKPWFAWTVHPDYMGQGVEDYLLQWMEVTAKRVIERCPKDAQISYRMNSYSTAKERIEFIERSGYQRVRNFYHMVTELNEVPPQAVLPEGIIIRTVRYPDELEAMCRALLGAFKDHWGYVDTPLAEEVEFWDYELKNDKLFDPSLYFLAADAETDEIAGFALCRSEQFDKPQFAYVMELGVLREYRRQGIALAMLHHAFGEFWRRGQKNIALHVDASSLTGATRLYEKAGMHPDETWLQFHKIIREGIDLSTNSVE